MTVVVHGTGAAVAAPRRPAAPPATSRVEAVAGVYAVPSHFQNRPNPAGRNFTPTAPRWPAAGTSTVTVQPDRSPRTPSAGAPVWARAKAGGSSSALGVRVYDQATAAAVGVHGVVFTVAADRSGPVTVGLDYSGFAQAYGGNYASRLRLVRLPDCALTTPDAARCRVPSPVTGAANDVVARSVSGDVDLTPAATTGVTALAAARPSGVVVLAATSDEGEEGGAGGTYAATDLKPSGSWSGGGSTGSFNYSYPLQPAGAATSLLPKLGLAYDSGSIDGQTASTQAQASWIGDGWSMPRSFIEQSFIPCADDPEGTASPQKTQDRCYDGKILTLSLNGSSTSLVWDSGASKWRPKLDDGSVVTQVVNSNNGQGTYNTDYWTVTTREGTVYTFGRNRLPGWSSGKATTNSVDYTPVFSAHSGDPCYNAAGFNSSVCTMAYRWNLDYVVDAHGSAMSYYYKQDTNYYGQNKGASNVKYIRDSHVDRIDYGFTDGNAYGTVPSRIVFNTGDRCLTGTCQPLNAANKANWPDVPFDLVCASGATCSAWSPAFFSTVRLTSVESQQWSTATSQYVPVDTYTLTQTLPPTGDGTSPTLWLSQIVHKGSDLSGNAGAGSPITMPAVTFGAVQLQNRVDTVTDGLPAFYKYRVQNITTESGAQITVTYGLANPCTAPVTVAPATNTTSCYPVSWTPPGYTDPFIDWFNKYVVTKVTTTDPTGGAPAYVKSYSYLGGAAWHFDDNELVKAKYRTYGQFRGYGDVKTFTGDGVNDPRELSEATYYRGMSKNNNSTVVNVTDSLGGVHEDLDELAGKALENTSWLGEGGTVDHSSITSYWLSAPTATRTRTGLPSLTARTVAPVLTLDRQAVTGSGATTWRYTATETTYDTSGSSATFGLPLRVYNHTVPADPAYDKCTVTSYAAANTAKNITGLESQVETDSVACGGFTQGSPQSVPGSVNTLTAPASVSRPAQVVSHVRNFYDDATFSTTFPQTGVPTKGDVTMVREAVDYTGGAFVYQTTARSVFDALGRQTHAYNANGDDTQTAFTMDSVGLTTGQSITNALGQVTSSTLAPARGLTLTATDINGLVTTQRYDALGRLTSVWTNSRSTSLPANHKFSYVIANNGVSASTTQKLNDSSGYITSTLIYDALLRPRQTQAMTPQGGRLITDTFYNSRGEPATKYNGWWDAATTPNTTLVSAADLHAAVPDQGFLTYDGLGRTVIEVSAKNGVEVSRTTTVYNGDRTTVIPPIGGLVETTVVDVLGRTVEVDRYATAPTLNTPANTFTGVFSVTGGTKRAVTYGYDNRGNQSTIQQGTNGPTWTDTYNLRARVVAKSDPDAGTSTFVYDAMGNQIQSTDALGKTVSTTYDALGRKTGRFLSTVAGQVPGAAGNQLAAWIYDNANNAVPTMGYPKGHLTTTISYAGGNTYTKQQSNYNVFGESTGITVTVPASEGNLAGTYTFTQLYTATTGLALKDVFPAAGGLPSETVLHGYSGALDLPNTLGGLTGYSQGTSYDAYARVTQQTLGAAPNLAYVTKTWDDHTGRLSDQLITRAVATPTNVDEQAYRYDLSGNITRQVSTRLGSAASSETRCHTYDDLNQLSASWTATDDCATWPSTPSHGMVGDSLGSSSAYWTSWEFDDLGDRSQQVQHAFTGGPSADITTGYTYGTGGAQLHTLTGTTTSGGSTGSSSYTYDVAGNMKTRAAGLGSQSFQYNDAGQLTSVTGGTGGPSSFLYDADGALLLQKDPGTTTLYLGTQQLVLNTTTGNVTGSRYYNLPGGGQVVRTGTGSNYKFAIGDHQGTPILYLDSTAQVPTWRQYTPYGGARGTAVAAPDNHGFLDKPMDANTGLTVVGSRHYDPAVGRFVTVDPILEVTDPSQLNGYGYGGNNPNTHADPTGNRFAEDDPGLDKIAKQLDDLAKEKARLFGKGRSIIAVQNTETGKVGWGVNGRGWHDPVTGELMEGAARVCGEDNACRNVGLDPNNPADRAKADFSKPYKGSLGTGAEPVPNKVCDARCQQNFVEEQFPKNTLAADGPDGSPGTWEKTRAANAAAAAAESEAALARSATAFRYASNGVKALGVVGAVAAVGFTVYDIANAPPDQRAEVAVKDVSSLAGGLAGGLIGAEIGAQIGIVGGPVGMLVGGVVGGIVGGIVGSGIGASVGNTLCDAGHAVASFFGW
ncbi:RHS repeat domain-containing protein [Catellatospora tritici]|uniref:RHS repeat domain-containing protein n=1 Tax=Catellatospora tritici TaxID=2851566 RepID=UPI0027DF8CD8|nr:RHS repeat-associated core domain-containing protein [Catellatospora tritici]